MMPDVLEQCIAAKQAPGLQFLMERGQYISDCVTVFPTMTASIDCSLITGVYPDRHKVPGLVWYDPEQKKMVNYINGSLPVQRIGVSHCAGNVLFDMNERHLSRDVKTIHEILEENKRVSGSINVIAHRGHKQHKVHMPPLLDAFTRYKLKEKVSGPTIMSLGTLVRLDLFRPVTWNLAQSMVEGYGINDTHAIDALIEVLKSGKQPHFTLVYLPDNDKKLHKSPHDAIAHLAAVDEELVRFLDSFDSWEQALERNVVMLISDHGQTVIGESKDHNISLDELLAHCKIHQLGTEVTDELDVVICNNERMTYLYPVGKCTINELVEAVSVDERIDLIAWREGDQVVVRRGGSNDTLRYWRNGEYSDVYGQDWGMEGEQHVLDVQLGGKQIGFNTYPDAFSRLYGALFSQSCPVVAMTATVGYQFMSELSPTHLGGGSHGSLHKRDSLIPLLIVGASQRFEVPARLVDVQSFILQELGVAVPASQAPQ
jgi:Type I phosphodiesterase / nucleotide pyrophosphatase